MTKTKQTAKKSTGSSAPCVSLQVDTGSGLAGENTASDGKISGDDEMEICTDDHNGVSVNFCRAL